MRSFISAFIIATLATLSSAAPVGLPSTTHAVSVPSAALPSTALPTTTALSVDSNIVDAVDPVPSQVSKAGVRAVPSSVAAIFNDVLTEIQPYATRLTFMTPSNASITEITNTVASIKGPIIAAVPVLQALVGQEASVILAPANPAVGDAELTVSDVATAVAANVDLVLAAAGSVIDVTDAVGGDIVTEVRGALLDLGAAVVGLVSATDALVDGLSASLAAKVEYSGSVLSYFDSVSLGLTLGLTV